MQTVVETPSYLADAERLFSPEERLAIVDRLAADPGCGVVIPGSGGIRKVRFGFGARGKSGGARIIYVFSGGGCPSLFWRLSPRTRKPTFRQPNVMRSARSSPK
jgi:hypothetical protein